MSESASMSLGIASRYAQALFEICKESGALDALERDADALQDALMMSTDLTGLITSPVVERDDQARAMAAIAAKMGLSAMMPNTIALMAQKRRLFVLPHLMADLLRRIADEKGVVTAEVTAAAALSDAQVTALTASLSARAGKTVKLKTTVDASLIGGLVVKLGSSMIDTSIKAKLAALQNSMKEVG